MLTSYLICSCGNTATQSKISAEMALEGVTNYCHSAYDWSIAEDNPSIMGVEMGEETDSAYQVVFRSYTGALVNFYVDKTGGTTRMVESVPALGIEEETGTINLFDYLIQVPHVMEVKEVKEVKWPLATEVKDDTCANESSLLAKHSSFNSL